MQNTIYDAMHNELNTWRNGREINWNEYTEKNSEVGITA